MACTDEKMMMRPAGCLDLPQTDVVRSRRLFSTASLKTTLKVPHERGVKQKRVVMVTMKTAPAQPSRDE